MTYLGLAGLLSLLAFGAVSALASFALRPAILRYLAGEEPRSSTLLALRFAPSLAATLFAGLIFLPGFLRLEPRHSGERIGPLLLGLSGAAALLLVTGFLRGIASMLATRLLERRWRSEATPIILPGSSLPAFALDVEFPLIAIVGILRPRLYVARRVLERCTSGELAAIVSHETGHFLRRDNLKRLLLRSCPDLLAFGSAGPALERAWSRACDRAADDHAARSGSRLDLAAALVKIGRSMVAPPHTGVALASFCHGDEIAARVKRLLRADPRATGDGAAAHHLKLVLALSVLTCIVIGQNREVVLGIHFAAETVVRWLQ